jgi:hypothetical protein
MYKGGLDGVTPGTSCIVSTCTSNHDKIASKDNGAVRRFAVHARAHRLRSVECMYPAAADVTCFLEASDLAPLKGTAPEVR